MHLVTPSRLPPDPHRQGCLVRLPAGAAPTPDFCTQVVHALGLEDLRDWLVSETFTDHGGGYLQLRLHTSQIAQWAPGLDTLQLTKTLGLDTINRPEDLQREIVIAMLMGPIAFEFPSVAELVSAVRIRANVVQAARKTMLDFHTTAIERPVDCWHYDPDRGFVILPGTSLVEALAKATQPEVSGKLYSFSCYRASEYVILLGIAQELQHCNPALYAQLETLWQTNPIKSGLFHDVFLHEQGSMEQPLPPHYFVPGDRTWFRNPDGASAEASGFEGSWVMYMGGGLFSNFWKREAPFTLLDKFLEIYHWRDGLYLDEDGDEQIDEVKVARYVAATRSNPAEVQRIVTLMERYREARGIYTDAGGCIDTTREFARWVCPGTSDMALPLPD